MNQKMRNEIIERIKKNSEWNKYAPDSIGDILKKWKKYLPTRQK